MLVRVIHICQLYHTFAIQTDFCHIYFGGLQTAPTGWSGFPDPTPQRPAKGQPVAPFPVRLLMQHHERHTIYSQEEGMRGMHDCQGEMHAAGRQPMPAVRPFGKVMHIP